MKNKKTFARVDLAKVISEKFNITKITSLDILESSLELLAEGLKEDGIVKIAGFGVFSIRKKAERIARNPRTGEAAVVSPRSVILFKASRQLKSYLSDN